MKSKFSLFVLLVIVFSLPAMAKDYNYLRFIELKEDADFVENEPIALELSGYLLSSPIDSVLQNPNRRLAMSFLLEWMIGCKYKFTITFEPPLYKMIEDSMGVLCIYNASMVKYVLEHKDKETDINEVRYNMYLNFIAYCEDPAHGVKPTETLKEFIEERKKNNLREAIGTLNIEED